MFHHLVSSRRRAASVVRGPKRGRGAATRSSGRRVCALVALAGALCASPARAADTSPAAELARWSGQAGAPGRVEAGREFFNATHGREWSCASCHGASPTGPGRHAGTGKAIAALAPGANPKSFTDAARVAKWFRRNCRDVLGRECHAAEKADLLAFLLSLRP